MDLEPDAIDLLPADFREGFLRRLEVVRERTDLPQRGVDEETAEQSLEATECESVPIETQLLEACVGAEGLG